MNETARAVSGGFFMENGLYSAGRDEGVIG